MTRKELEESSLWKNVVGDCPTTQEPSEEKKHAETCASWGRSITTCDCGLIADAGKKVELSENEKWHKAGWDDATETIKSKIPFLRQMINERPEGRTFTTEDLGFMLGLNTMEEVEEARRREKAISERNYKETIRKL